MRAASYGSVYLGEICFAGYDHSSFAWYVSGFGIIVNHGTVLDCKLIPAKDPLE
jgi:hypothetical protein